MRTSLIILTLLTAAFAGGLPSGDRAAVAADKPRPPVVIAIRGGQFTPNRVTLRAGDTVIWSNGDDRDHTVIAAGGAFNSGNIRPGGSFAWRATKGGEYAYGCTIHPRMRGVISVQ